MAEPYLQCPKEWSHTTLMPNAHDGFIISVETGSTPSTTNPNYWDGDIPWLTPKEITGTRDTLWVSQTERLVTHAGLSSCSAKLLPAGTVMLTKRAPVGAVAVSAIPMATNQGFLNFVCGNRLRPLYFAYWLKVNRPYLELVANGSTYPELYKGDLFEFEISIPTLAEQDRVLAILNAIQFAILMRAPLEQTVNSPASMTALQEQARELSRIRDTLLPLLLSGQLNTSNVRTNLMVE